MHTTILVGAALLVAPAAAATMEQITADLRACMQRAVVSLDDKASDVRIIAHFLPGRCQREALAFLDASDRSGGTVMDNIAIAVVLESRAPRWWQFWK